MRMVDEVDGGYLVIVAIGGCRLLQLVCLLIPTVIGNISNERWTLASIVLCKLHICIDCNAPEFSSKKNVHVDDFSFRGTE